MSVSHHMVSLVVRNGQSGNRFPLPFFLCLVAFASGCIDSLPSTPTSSLVIVSTGLESVRLETGVERFVMPVIARNTSGATLYYRSGCEYTLEKAEHYRWWQRTTVCAALTTGSIPPDGVIGFDAIGTPHPDLDGLTGKWRVYVHLYRDPEAQDRLPASAGFSRPFDVIR